MTNFMTNKQIDYQNYTLQVRLYPTKEQIVYLNKAFGSTRFVYNYFLNKSQEEYKNKKKCFNCIEQERELTKLIKTDEYIWLKEVDSQCLKSSLKHLDKAYKNFYKAIKEKKQYTFRFKSKHTHKDSFTSQCINNNCKIDFETRKIKIPKLKTWIKFRDDRIIDYNSLQSITIKRTPSGNYYASILFRIPKQIANYQVDINKSIGLDFGLKNFITTSKGEKIYSSQPLKKNIKKLAKLSKQHSKKKANSKNKEKARIKLAKCQEKIANIRKYWNHCLSKQLSNNYDFVFIEDLNISAMQKLWGRKISDIAWYQFTTFLNYKMINKGKYCLKIDRYFPSSKTCNHCGYKKEDLSLSDRSWVCPNCGDVHDRDLNAAKNILKEGLKHFSTGVQSGFQACGY